MPLINCKINIILTSSVDCIISFNTNANKAFAITYRKLCVSLRMLLTNENIFEELINWNKYQSKVITEK